MTEPSPSFRSYEIREQLGERAKNLLPSQRAYIFAPERFSAISGGFGSGKSFALVMKGLVLAAAIPGNVGAFLCYRGTDVEKRLIPLFVEEVCPPQWIKRYNKNKRTILLRNNSVISFEHIKDSTGGAGTGTRRIGANWGFFGVDQAEEISREHWDALTSRLRLPRAKKKFGFASLNPGGRDWIWEKFFQKVVPWPRDEQNRALPLNGKFFQAVRQAPDHLGISVNSEENRISNGGFVEDAFYDSLLQNYGEQWVERFVYGTFDDFKGKMFPDFAGGLVDREDASVHVIKSFPIPRHWSCVGGIDPGGDSKWAVTPVYADERGNLIAAQGFHNRTGRVSEVANWIKRNMPWDENRTTFVLDPENKIVTIELSDYGIYAMPAIKDINPGLMRLESYMHVVKHRDLPEWYESTQPQHRWLKYRTKGSPKFFVFEEETIGRRELDKCKWDPDKIDKMYKTSTERFDSVEAYRYVAMTKPEPSKMAEAMEEKYRAMEKRDPATAREWKAYDQRMAARKGGKTALRDMDLDDAVTPVDNLGERTGKYDWADDA
jgi:hypothetical protein